MEEADKVVSLEEYRERRRTNQQKKLAAFGRDLITNGLGSQFAQEQVWTIPERMEPRSSLTPDDPSAS